ncbi:MAG: Mfa1 family fimbria major subunit [Paramuribaculum sp.]|nr:Mfa1 family fimbria major subunit [Paramuribaculum sp.]
MKIFGKYLLIPAMALGLWSCSDDAPEVNTPEESLDELYMSVKIQLPTSNGSRSVTTNPGNASNDGTEVGKDYENKVSKVLLVLADVDDNSFISYKTIDNISQTNTNLVVTGTFNKSVLVNYLEDKPDGWVMVYAFCNYTDELEAHIAGRSRGDAKSLWADEQHTIKSATDESIWSKNNFLMANESMTKCSLPGLEAINSGLYNDKNNPYPLTGNGAVRVQRSVARFDFMDGSDGNCTYTFAKNDEQQTILQVQLTEMSLVNLSKSFYHLMRTSRNGLIDNYELCGKDMPTQAIEDNNMWVVDTDADRKAGIHEDVYENFFCWSGNGNQAGTWNPAAWDTWKISDVLNGDDQNFEGWNGSANKRKGYKIWRYATENTIPAPAANQRQGITTGVIFKGMLTATANAPQNIKEAIAAHSDLYAYKGNLYGSWDDIAEFIEELGDNTTGYTDLVADYKNCTEATAVSVGGFTRYQYSDADNGYPMYYPYWNRHNNNDNNSVMGHMEFQVVRNNIYKLRVTSINSLGHPVIPDDDPDPFDPEDPDEKEDVYFTVEVMILPWVVRVNDIDF